jgi:hypothetical protein
MAGKVHRPHVGVTSGTSSAAIKLERRDSRGLWQVQASGTGLAFNFLIQGAMSDPTGGDAGSGWVTLTTITAATMALGSGGTYYDVIANLPPYIRFVFQGVSGTNPVLSSWFAE